MATMHGYRLNNTNSSTNCTPMKYEEFLMDEFTHEPIASSTIVVSAVYGLICLIGLVANAALIGSLLVGKKRSAIFRAPSTILILNLAIADTMLLLTLPFAIVHRLSNSWIFGNFFCKVEEVLKFMSFYASVFFITAMAVDRYYILCHPIRYNRTRARSILWLVSLMIWCLALLIDIPIMLYAHIDYFGICSVNFPGGEISFTTHTLPLEYDQGLEDYPEYLTNCMDEMFNLSNYFDYYGEHLSEESLYTRANAMPASVFALGDYRDIPAQFCSHPPFRSLHIWLASNFVIGFVFPFAVISVCYINIMRLKSNMTSANGNNERRFSSSDGEDVSNIVKTSGDNAKKKRKEKILSFNNRAKMIMGVLIPCLILAFLICWLPYHTWHLIQIEGAHVDLITCSLIRDATFCLAFFNSALNPVLNSLFLFNNKGRLQRFTTWLVKVTHFGGSSTYSTVRVRYTSTRSNETGQDSRSLPEETLIFNA